jgi:molybdenum cofactor cytidylyltransferase
VKPSLSTAAVILAAGTSSRMLAGGPPAADSDRRSPIGMGKPLLSLGSGSVIERVVRSVRQAGVDEVLVVTGHRSEELTPVLSSLGVRQVHNADYEAGMFSSVRTGVGALGGDVDAFFVLPVDCALTRPHVLERLLRSHREAGGGILHPTCCGRRGHPPLISGRYREELSLAGEPEDLRSFLRRHSGIERDVEVEDLTILMDMDTPEEHQRLRRFATIIDAAEAGWEEGETSLSSEDALYLLSALAAPDHLVRHCQAVAAVGVALAEALEGHVPALDVGLVRSACLLHDMAKGARRHAAVGQSLLDSLGLHRLGSLVGSHMVPPSEQWGTASPREEQLVFLADKLVVDERVVGLEERTAQALSRCGRGNAASLLGAETRMQVARVILNRVETILGHPLEEVFKARRRRPARRVRHGVVPKQEGERT